MSEQRVLELYVEYMLAAQLEHNDDKRIARILTLLEHLQAEAPHLEEQMVTALRAGDAAGDQSIFTVLIDRCLLVEAMEQSRQAGRGRAVLIACGEKGLAINGRRLSSLWSSGQGIVVIDRRSMSALLRFTTGDVVGMRCLLDHWLAWTSDDAGPIRSDEDLPGGCLMLHYYRKSR